MMLMLNEICVVVAQISVKIKRAPRYTPEAEVIREVPREYILHDEYSAKFLTSQAGNCKQKLFHDTECIFKLIALYASCLFLLTNNNKKL